MNSSQAVDSTAKALGLGVELEYKGKIYKLSPWTYKIQAEFESYLQDHAIRTVKRMRQHLSEPEYRQLLQDVQRDISAGYYTFGSSAVHEALQTFPHFCYLTYLSLRKEQPDIALEFVQEMLKDIYEEVAEKTAEINSDPNSPAAKDENPTPPSPAPLTTPSV